MGLLDGCGISHAGGQPELLLHEAQVHCGASVLEAATFDTTGNVNIFNTSGCSKAKLEMLTQIKTIRRNTRN